MATAMSGQTLNVSITKYTSPGVLGTPVLIGGVDGWSFDNKVDSKDITCASMDLDVPVVWKSYLATLRDASGTITLKYLDFTDPGQWDMWELFLGTNNNNIKVNEIRFYQDETHYMFADCIITSFPLNAKVDGVQGEGMSISLQLSDTNGLQMSGY
jgi:hypothetical protein